MPENLMERDEMPEAKRVSIDTMNAEKRAAIAADLARRMATAQQLFRRCLNRGCRRLEACMGADRPCLQGGSLPPLSNNARKRLTRAFRNDPPRL